MRSLSVDFTFVPQNDGDRQLLGYKLYQNNQEVCKTSDPAASRFTCDFLTEDGTFDFTLTAYYSDGTESEQSSSFPLTVGQPAGTSSSDDPADSPPDTSSTTPAEPSPQAEMRSLDIDLTFAAAVDPDRQLQGYRLYQEGEPVCESNNPDASVITCELLTTEGTFSFTLTAYYSDGSESRPSLPFPFTIGPASTTPPDPSSGPLQAVIKSTFTGGEVPLKIVFDGASSSGNVSVSFWEFGDGASSTGPAASHTYLVPGTYTVSLTVEGQEGTTHQTTTTITARQAASAPETPTAVLSSSTAAGNAPLKVNFNGTSSTTPNPPIVRYDWTFGDSSRGTGATISHTYITSGTYHTELTVEDSKGLTAKIDTPIIVIGSVAPNQKPTAAITTDMTQGNAPLAVTFDASKSADPDGTITQYNWNFGDGTAAIGRTVKHTYTDPANYAVSLEVIDDRGGIAAATKIITCDTPGREPNFEVGKITITHEWVKVLFENTFSQPVVIAGPATATETDPIQIRIRNVDRTGFEIRLHEWSFKNNHHAEESFSYIVMEKGLYTLANGTRIEAATFQGSSSFRKIMLHQPYSSIPVILSQIVTANETGGITGKIQNSSRDSFAYKLQKYPADSNSAVQSKSLSKVSFLKKNKAEDSKDGATQLAKMEEIKKVNAGGQTATETIGYIAWEPGNGEVAGLLYETGTTEKRVSSNWFEILFKTEFSDIPLFIAALQTNADRNNIGLRS
ncbi:MAG: PKD domain-containing protein, partial [Deltaproteobacteria bacterium]|nr:PKD domain-containing protein [Deltaproteobacteria bacterium]